MGRQSSAPPKPADSALARLRQRGAAAAEQVAQAPVSRLAVDIGSEPAAAGHGQSTPSSEHASSEPSALQSSPAVGAPVAVTSTASPRSTSKVKAKQAPRRAQRGGEAMPKPVMGPRGRLGANGEKVVKLTMELPEELVDRINAWEVEETRRTGKRVHRERLIDLALDGLPDEVEDIVALTRELPDAYLDGELEPVGTRVRASVQGKLLTIRPQLKIRRLNHVYQWHVYAAAIDAYLNRLDDLAASADDRAGEPKAAGL